MSATYFAAVKRHAFFIVLCLIFSVASYLLIVHWYQYNLNPDALSYITIAEKYAHFDFRHAINGYWSPMFSWLMVPAVWLHANLIIAARLVMALAGLAILIAVYIFLIGRDVSRTVATLATAILSIIIINGVTTQPITPDIIEALGILLFAFSLFRFTKDHSVFNSFLVALSGAAIYYSKGFGFYIFIAMLALLLVWDLWKLKYPLKKVIKNYIFVVVLFAVLVGPFIGVISLKYHMPTISTAGSFNHDIFGPISQGKDFPMVTSGPFAPPNSTAVSIWEDPTSLTTLIPDHGWSPLSSGSNFKYFIESVLGSYLGQSMSILVAYGPFVVFGVLILAVGWMKANRFKNEFALMGLISIITIVGYSLIYIESRYLLGVVVLAVVGGALWLSLLEKRGVMKNLQVIVAGVILVSTALLPVGQMIVAQKSTPQDTAAYNATAKLSSVLPKGAHVVSDTFSSYTACFELSLHCYGALILPGGNVEASFDLIKSDGITYYIDLGTRPNDTALAAFISAHFTPVRLPADAAAANIAVYHLNN
jgi:dolichyl-phosphate-mannose-protein mannosyltransferase